MKEITQESLAALRQKISGEQSEKRFCHTQKVEEMVVRLCQLFCPEYENELRAAALLHDVTKEKKTEEQRTLFEILGLDFTPADARSPKTLHARSAAALIPVQYPDFANEITVSAVRWHTTGHKDMTLTEKLLYLADYIDDSRTYANCVALRNAFWQAEPQNMEMPLRLSLLHDVLVASFDMTVEDLLREGLPISVETVEARNALLAEA